MRAVIGFFLSLKTAFWLFLIFIVLLFIGSLILPGNLAFFSGIDDTPLFRWLSADSKDLKLTWWIYAMLLLLFILALSTILCTVEALMKRLSIGSIILKLSPQIMHIGVLFIMLGHLLTASSGFKTDILVKKGISEIIDGGSIYLEDIAILTDKNGYETDWEAKIAWLEETNTKQMILKPAQPVYLEGLGLYLKSVSEEPEPSALIRVCRDPGAIWALIGGILLLGGGMGFLYGRFST